MIVFSVRWDATFGALQRPTANDGLPSAELAVWDRYARQLWLVLVEAWLPSASNFGPSSGRSQARRSAPLAS